MVWRQVTRTARNIYIILVTAYFYRRVFLLLFLCVSRLQSAHTPHTRQYAKWFRLEQTVFTFCVKFIYLTIERKNTIFFFRLNFETSLLCLLQVCMSLVWWFKKSPWLFVGWLISFEFLCYRAFDCLRRRFSSNRWVALRSSDQKKETSLNELYWIFFACRSSRVII